ncbi:uncharacterized protein [Haliotis cracherodii]
MNKTAGINGTEPEIIEEVNPPWSGLTQAEVVVVGAVGAVILLATLAVVLRIIMPRVRRRSPKEKVIPRKPIVEEKTGNLLAPGTPSSQSSRSTSSRSSNHGDWSDASSYKTKSTYYSQNSLFPGKPNSFSNLRQQAGLSSANASPASYRSKTTERLNDDLISMISQQSNVLEPLNLGEQYRSNWEQTFEEQHAEKGHTNISYVSHPSDNIVMPDRYDTYPFRHTQSSPRSQETRPVPIIVYPEQTRL